jgi:hypothetical protein
VTKYYIIYFILYRDGQVKKWRRLLHHWDTEQNHEKQIETNNDAR